MKVHSGAFAAGGTLTQGSVCAAVLQCVCLGAADGGGG